MLIEVDEGRCVGCGRCVADCVGSNLRVEAGVARVRGRCILCGHCVAVCPEEAVSIPCLDMADVEPAAPAAETIDAAALLRAIKSRRSVRDYLARRVGDEALSLVLEAGRYTATAKNAQGCRFIVVQDGLEELKRIVWDGIDGLLELPASEAPRWTGPYRSFARDVRRDPACDFLFRNAPAALFVAAERADDAGLAAQSMELVAASAGLGALYNGYLCRAVEAIPQARAFVGADERPLQVCMLLGYPAVSYARTAPRKPGDFVVR